MRSLVLQRYNTDYDIADYATEPDKVKFLAEITLMKRLAQDLGFYEHIVNPLSCITTSMPYCLVIEFCSDGNLLDFLRDRRNYMLKVNVVYFLC